MRKLRNALLGAAIGLAVVAGTTPAHADNASAVASLQTTANNGVAAGYPGVISLLRDDAGSTYVTAGTSIKGSNTPIDPTGQFRIGSNSKTFTATVILQLEAEGKLSLDDTVAKWLPNAVVANGYDGHTITIRQLLTHTSGLPDYDQYQVLPGVTLAWAYYNTDLRGNHYTPQNLVDTALLVKPGPGERKWSYANTNYILAGMIIQAVTGHDPSTEITNRIITPLGLTGTSFPPSDPNLYGNFVHGWKYNAFGQANDVSASNVELFWSAGAIVSTLPDMATFLRALIRGQLLPPAQTAELKTTVPAGTGVDFGAGIAHITLPCAKGAWGHGGLVLGYYTRWYASDDGSKIVVILGNESHGDDGTNGQGILQSGAQQALCHMLS